MTVYDVAELHIDHQILSPGQNLVFDPRSCIGLKHLKSHPDYPTRPGRSGMVEFYAMSGSEYFELSY